MRIRVARASLGALLLALFLNLPQTLCGVPTPPSLGVYDIVTELQFTQVLMRSAVLGRSTDDIRVYTEEVLRLLGSMTAGSSGIISALRWLCDHPAEAGVIQPEHYDEFALIAARAADFLERAVAACSEVLGALDGHTDIGDARERAYAYIVAAIGSDDDPFALAGVAEATTYVPRRVERLVPGDDIQAAIDRLPEGGLIYLEAGSYVVEGLSIGRSLTLSRDPAARGSVTLVGTSANPVISVTGLDVRADLRGLVVQGGDIGVQVDGISTLHGVDCTFTRNRSAGIQALGDSDTVLIQCKLFDNGRYGLAAGDRASIIVTESTIDLNGDYGTEDDPLTDNAGIRLSDSSQAWISSSRLRLNRGHATLLTEFSLLVGVALTMDFNSGDDVLLFDMTQLHLVSCRFTQVVRQAIRTYGSDCLQDSVSWRPERDFTGRITGSQNVIQPSSFQGDHPLSCFGDTELPEGFFEQ